MNAVITALVELQGIDDEIREYQVQRDELAGNLERLRSILDSMGKGLDDKRERLSEAVRFHSDKRIELEADAERLNNAKTKLVAVTKTKEYAAMQREMDTLRKKFSESETELERLAHAIAEYQANIAVEEAKLDELRAEVTREAEASAGRLTDLTETMDRIGLKKKAVTGALDKGLLGRYGRILQQREGKAVVPVIAGHCSGCRMMLPPQQYIIIQRGETLQSCPSCQRFLFYTAEIAAAAAAGR